jgi:hypothetical protein
LNRQAARFSYEARVFLSSGERLSLLVKRDVEAEWPRKVAPRDWGAWYVLHYRPGGSERGFLFDGQARPLPVLRRLAPESQLRRNPACTLAGDRAWDDGLLYVTLHEDGLTRDETGGLFRARVKEGNPQVGRTYFGARIEGVEGARSVAVEAGRCAVLMAPDLQPKGRVATSTDLNRWDVLFEGRFPAVPLCIELIDGDGYVGLDNGSVVLIREAP